MAVSGRSRGATAAGHGWDGGDDWMAFTRSTRALETTGQVTQIHARLTRTESATQAEKRNPAGQVEYGWSPARARRAPLLELEDDWMGLG